MKFAIDGKYYIYLRHNNRTLIAKSLAVAQRGKEKRKKRKKTERESLELLASGSPQHQDVLGARMSLVSGFPG